MIIKHHCC